MKNYYLVQLATVDTEKNKIVWKSLGVVYGCSAAAKLRQKYKKYVTRRRIVAKPAQVC